MFGGQRCGTTHIWVVRRQTVKEFNYKTGMWIRQTSARRNKGDVQINIKHLI